MTITKEEKAVAFLLRLPKSREKVKVMESITSSDLESMIRNPNQATRGQIAKYNAIIFGSKLKIGEREKASIPM